MSEPETRPRIGDASPRLIVQGRRQVRWVLLSVVSISVLGLLVLFGYGLILAGRSGGIGINASGAIGRIPPGPASNFEMSLFSGGAFRLDQQRGKVVLINFWASWCVPCRDEAPVLERAWMRYRAPDVVFVGVDIWDSNQDARNFLTQFGITYPNGPDRDGRTAIEYGVTGIPETYVIRSDGTVASHWIGPLTDGEIATLLQSGKQ